jgi:hypothetical protein
LKSPRIPYPARPVRAPNDLLPVLAIMQLHPVVSCTPASPLGNLHDDNAVTQLSCIWYIWTNVLHGPPEQVSQSHDVANQKLRSNFSGFRVACKKERSGAFLHQQVSKKSYIWYIRFQSASSAMHFALRLATWPKLSAYILRFSDQRGPRGPVKPPPRTEI